MKVRYFVLAFVFVFLSLLSPPSINAQIIDPQYIFVRKDPMTCNPSDCSMLWNMDDPKQINLNSINDVFTKIGTKGNSAGTRKVGIAVYLNFFIGADINTKIQSLKTLLNASVINDFPVYIAFDEWVWMDNRPDLWNWWDPTKPGYNPANINNVEWTCWDSSCAIKKSWRNWGSEFEVKPQPNLASQAVIGAAKGALNQALPVVVNWYNTLPENKKYLLGGIDIGGEVDIGANYYYYPNGISNGKGLPDSVQLGYNAVKTAGIKSSGTLTGSDIDEVARRYQTELNKLAYDLGIPRQKIFNHSSAKGYAPFIVYPAGVAFTTPYESLNNYAHPGWSFYGEITSKLASYNDLNSILNQTGNNEWGVPEWLTFAQDLNGWTDSLKKTLGYRNNRLLNIANWEGVRDNATALSAIRTVANEDIDCWVTTPHALNESVNGTSANLTWQKGANNTTIYLNVTTSTQFNYTGTFASVDIYNGVVTSQNSQILNNLAPGRYKYLLAADGCTNQRKIAYGEFTIGSGTIPSTPSGDFNGDGLVNDADYKIIIADFATKYNIYDYNALVTNYNLATPTPVPTVSPTTKPAITPSPTPAPVVEQYSFGSTGDIPLVGRWFGGNIDTPAVVRGSDWYMKKTFAGAFADSTINISYTPPAKAYYLACDWDGNGTDSPTIVSNGVWNIRNANTTGAPDKTFAFGNTTDIPVCGDWDGNGTDSAGVFRGNQWYLSNDNVNALITFTFGNTGDLPIVGHWTGTKQDFPGVYRNATFYLKNSTTNDGIANSTIAFGNPGDIPIIGDWTGAGKSLVGVVRGTTWFIRK